MLKLVGSCDVASSKALIGSQVKVAASAYTASTAVPKEDDHSQTFTAERNKNYLLHRADSAHSLMVSSSAQRQPYRGEPVETRKEVVLLTDGWQLVLHLQDDALTNILQ